MLFLLVSAGVTFLPGDAPVPVLVNKLAVDQTSAVARLWVDSVTAETYVASGVSSSMELTTDNYLENVAFCHNVSSKRLCRPEGRQILVTTTAALACVVG